MRPLLTRRSVLALFVSASVALAGCDGFFDKKSSSGGSTTGTGNYAYVATGGATNLSGYQIDKAGTLTAISGSVSLPANANALTVSRGNKYLWAGTPSGIYGYNIGSAGALTTISSGQLLGTGEVLAMDTTADGKWLLVLIRDLSLSYAINVFSITSTGTLTPSGSLYVSGYTGTPTTASLRISPNYAYAAVTLGTSGTAMYTFNTATGTLAQQAIYNTNSGLLQDQTATFSPDSKYLYLARSGSNGGVDAFNVNTNGTLSAINSTRYSASASGSSTVALRSIITDNAGKYVYVANANDNAIYGFVIGTNGALTAAPSSPYSAGSGVTALGADLPGNYILAASANGTPDVAMFGFDGTTTNAGRIYPVTSAAASSRPTILALTR